MLTKPKPFPPIEPARTYIITCENGMTFHVRATPKGRAPAGIKLEGTGLAPAHLTWESLQRALGHRIVRIDTLTRETVWAGDGRRTWE